MTPRAWYWAPAAGFGTYVATEIGSALNKLPDAWLNWWNPLGPYTGRVGLSVLAFGVLMALGTMLPSRPAGPRAGWVLGLTYVALVLLALPPVLHGVLGR